MLILLRHGRTAANAAGLLQGRIDHPLDDEGWRQARACADHLNRLYPGARVISSPLTRALQTAEALGAPVEIDERFIELDYGSFDGLAMGEVPVDTWSTWRADPSFRPPGGETLLELHRRVESALVELAETARDSDVVVVSHVSPIKSAVTWALGVGPEATWRCSLDRASITRIAVSPRGPSLVGFNETHHLG